MSTDWPSFRSPQASPCSGTRAQHLAPGAGKEGLPLVCSGGQCKGLVGSVHGFYGDSWGVKDTGELHFCEPQFPHS